MAEKSDSPVPDAASPVTAMKVATRRKVQPTTQKLPPFNVVLLDDDDHSYEYVIEMLGKVFGHSVEKAFLMAKEVDSKGRVIVLTTHKERAELKRDQILAYGPDARIAACTISMKSIIEPAEG